MRKILVTLCLSSLTLGSISKPVNAIMEFTSKTNGISFMLGGFYLLGGPIYGAVMLSSSVKENKTAANIAKSTFAMIFAPITGLVYLDEQGQASFSELDNQKVAELNSKLSPSEQLTLSEVSSFNSYRTELAALALDAGEATKDMSLADAKAKAEEIKAEAKANIDDVKFNEALTAVEKITSINN